MVAAASTPQQDARDLLHWVWRVVENTQLSASDRLALIGVQRELLRRPYLARDAMRPVFLPNIAKHAGLSESTIGRSVKRLEAAGALVTEDQHKIDATTGMPRISKKLAVTPQFEHPESLIPPAPRNHGGKRPRCKECGSEDVFIQRVCRSCGTIEALGDESSTAENPHQATTFQVDDWVDDADDDGNAKGADHAAPTLHVDAAYITNDVGSGSPIAPTPPAEPTFQVDDTNDAALDADRQPPPLTIPPPGDRTLDGTRQLVTQLRAAGYAPIPLVDKIPVAKGWPTRSFVPADWTLDDTGRPLGIGLRCGLQPDGAYLHAIDLDNHDVRQDAAAALAQGIDQLPASLLSRITFSRSTGGHGRYVLLRSTLEVAAGDVAERNGYKAGELLAGCGRQVVLPPSAHWLSPAGLPTFVLDAGETRQVLEAFGAAVVSPAPVRSTPLVGSCPEPRDPTPRSADAPRTRPPALDDPQWRARAGSAADHYWFAFLPTELAGDFNARHTVDDLLPFGRDGMALATWRGDTKPSVHRLEDGGGWIDFGAAGKDGKCDGGDALDLACRLEQVSRADKLAVLGRTLLNDLTCALEDAARSNGMPPAWVARYLTPAGWTHYDTLCLAETPRTTRLVDRKYPHGASMVQPSAVAAVPTGAAGYVTPIHAWNAAVRATDYAQACAIMDAYSSIDWTAERQYLAAREVP